MSHLTRRLAHQRFNLAFFICDSNSGTNDRSLSSLWSCAGIVQLNPNQFAIEVSKTSMNAAKATVAAISHGFDFGFHCVQSQPSAFILILLIGFV